MSRQYNFIDSTSKKLERRNTIIKEKIQKYPGKRSMQRSAHLKFFLNRIGRLKFFSDRIGRLNFLHVTKLF